MANRTGPRRNKQWSFIPGFLQAFSADTTIGPAAFSFVDHTTVFRMLGEYIIAPTSAPTALDRADVTVAIGVVSIDAFTAGGASLPDPAGNPEYPWLYWRSHPFHAGSTDSDVGGSGLSTRVPFDIKSMRKISPSQSLVFVGQYADVNGTPPLTWSAGITRILLAR